MTEAHHRTIKIGSTCMRFVPPESKESGPVYRAGPIFEPRARGVSWAAKIIRLAMFGGKGPQSRESRLIRFLPGPINCPEGSKSPETLSHQGHPIGECRCRYGLSSGLPC